MKRYRSKAVSLAMIPLIAASFTACGADEEETAYCVNENDEVVDDDLCGDERAGGGAGFFFLYAAGGFGRGQRVTGASTRIPSTDKRALARRGGFGSRASGGVGRRVSGGGSGRGFSGGG
jgi:hypothetical protein